MKNKMLKKLLALCLTMAMLMGIVPGFGVQNAFATDLTVWDGTTKTAFTSGDGSKVDPYIIDTAGKLAYLAEQVNAGTSYASKYFKLTENLDLNNKEWTPIGTQTTIAFRGMFDGQDKSITGLKIGTQATPNTTLGGAALFGFVGSGATIQNMSANVDIYSNKQSARVGGLIGYLVSATVDNCHVSGKVSGAGMLNSVGGLLADNNGEAIIINSSSSAEISAGTAWGAKVGGLIGQSDGENIKNCFATGNVSASGTSTNTNVGGFIGYSYKTIQNCYATGNVSGAADAYVGGFLGDFRGGTISNTYWNSDATQTVGGTERTTKKGTGNGAESTTPKVMTQMKLAAGEAGALVDILNANKPAGDNTWFAWVQASGKNGGYPTLQAPHVMTDAEAVDLDKTWLDEAQITFANSETKDTVKGNFTVPTSGQNGSTIAWSANPSDVISFSEGSATVTQKSDDVTVTLTATLTKGTASDTKDITIKVLKNAPTDLTVWDGTTKTAFTSGDGSKADPYIIDTAGKLAYLAQEVNGGTSYSGKYFKLTENINLNNKEWTPIGKSVDYSNPKPFCGYFDGEGHTISNLSITMNLTGNNDVTAGLFGYMDGGTASDSCDAKIIDLSVSGTINATGDNAIWAGGILGYGKNIRLIENCNADVTITAKSNAATPNGSRIDCGALVGNYWNPNVGGKINNCHTKGSVTGNKQNVTTGGSRAGGLVGAVNAGNETDPLIITNCSSAVSVDNTSKGNASRSGCTGGLIGEAALKVKIFNSFARGTVSGTADTSTMYIGGFVGKTTDLLAMENCYSAGATTGGGATQNKVGGFAGGGDDKVKNCYWLSTAASTGIAEGTPTSLTSLTSTQMTAAAGQADALVDTLNANKPADDNTGFVWKQVSDRNDGYPTQSQISYAPAFAAEQAKVDRAESAFAKVKITNASTFQSVTYKVQETAQTAPTKDAMVQWGKDNSRNRTACGTDTVEFYVPGSELNNLKPATNYTIYLLAEQADETYQAEVTAIPFTTKTAAPAFGANQVSLSDITSNGAKLNVNWGSNNGRIAYVPLLIEVPGTAAQAWEMEREALAKNRNFATTDGRGSIDITTYFADPKTPEASLNPITVYQVLVLGFNDTADDGKSGNPQATMTILPFVTKSSNVPELQPPGLGTQESPFLISTPDHLKWMSANTMHESSFGGMFFKQTADIDMSAVTDFKAIGAEKDTYFEGFYNGNGFKIKNLTIHKNTTLDATNNVDYTALYGLFGHLDGATIQNLTLEDLNIDIKIANNSANPGVLTTEAYIGGVAAVAYDSTITNCRVVESAANKSQIKVEQTAGKFVNFYVGGIVAEAGRTKLNGVENQADLRGIVMSEAKDHCFGGIVQKLRGGKSEDEGYIKNAVNSGDIVLTGTMTMDGRLCLGGVTSQGEHATISNTINVGKIDVSGLTYPSDTDFEKAIGGSVALSIGNVLEHNYYLEGTAATGSCTTMGDGISLTDAQIAKKTDAELKTAATFTGWDADVWDIAEGRYPTFKVSNPASAAIAAAKAVLTEETLTFASGDSKSSVTSNLTVPLTGEQGTTISWSENSEYISIDPATGKVTVTRPAASVGDKTVTLTATISKQGGTSVTKELSFTVKAAVSGGNSGGSGSGSGKSDANSNTNAEQSIILDGNKKETDVAKQVTGKNEQGQTVTTITMDEKKLEKLLDAMPKVEEGKENHKPIISIPVLQNRTDAVVGELNGQTVKAMEQKAAVLEIKTQQATYTLPANQINIDAVSQQLGSTVALGDIKVQVQIAQPTAEKVKFVEDTANKGAFTMVVPPVDFQITCTYKDKKVEVSRFDGYVDRRIAIPAGVDPKKITTGVVTDMDGTTRHVPTKVIEENGQYYAEINSLTNSIYAVIWHPVTFKDVEKHWAKTSVNDMGSRMVVSGDGDDRYDPDQSITRAEFATIIVRALGLAEETTESSFRDVSKKDWFCGYVMTATKYGLIQGYDQNSFGPNDLITREQAMAILNRAMKLTGLKANLEEAEKSSLLSHYKDLADISSYAKDSTAACIKTEIVAGRDGNLIAPKANITRAEVAVIVQRLLQKSGLI